MSADLRIDFGFFDHRKTKKLIARCGLQGVWSLQKLWRKTAETRPKGKLTGMDETDIALDAEWLGEAAEFCLALFEIHWMDKGEDGVYELHDWQQHQPWIYFGEERSEIARQNVSKRWAKRTTRKRKEYKSNTDGIEPVYQPDTPSPSPNPNPSPNPIHLKDRKDIPPGFDSVKAYCEERKNNINPQKFIDHYGARGWMIGKNKMKDWQAAVRTWEENQKDNPTSGPVTLPKYLQGLEGLTK